MIHSLGTTKNGIEVLVELIKSPAAAKIARQPYLLVLAKEVLQQTAFKDQFVRMEFDMKRPIGYDFVVPTTKKDIIFYAKLLRDDVYSRFVKHSKALPVQSLVIIMDRNETGEYELQDVWVGHLSLPRPGSKEESSESKPYWDSHAIVADGQAVQSNTITKTRPY